MSELHDVALAAREPMELGSLVRAAVGTGITVAGLNDWITLAAGLATLIYTALKIIDWWETRQSRKEEQKTLSQLYASMRRARMISSEPVPLDEDSGHDNGRDRQR